MNPILNSNIEHNIEHKIESNIEPNQTFFGPNVFEQKQQQQQ